MINVKEVTEWATAFLVVISGALAGHYAAEGMSAIQWAGAASSVLGSVTLAVAVRVWPAPIRARDARFKD